MTPRSSCAVLLLASCTFAVPAGTSTDAAIDAPPDIEIDAPPPFVVCPPDPQLRVCFTFDESPLPPTLPNEGGAAVSAQLRNVARTAAPRGGAVDLGMTGSVFLPLGSGVTGIQTIEMWFRLDGVPPNLGRSGLVDSNVIPPNISLFVYRDDPVRRLRCGIGGQLEVMDAVLPTGVWTHVACTCDGTAMTMYIDGASIGTRNGTCGSGGAFVDHGFTIGSDNTGQPDVYGERFSGAIDALRLWDTHRTAAQLEESLALFR